MEKLFMHSDADNEAGNFETIHREKGCESASQSSAGCRNLSESIYKEWNNTLWGRPKRYAHSQRKRRRKKKQQTRNGQNGDRATERQMQKQKQKHANNMLSPFMWAYHEPISQSSSTHTHTYGFGLGNIYLYSMYAFIHYFIWYRCNVYRV